MSSRDMFQMKPLRDCCASDPTAWPGLPCPAWRLAAAGRHLRCLRLARADKGVSQATPSTKRVARLSENRATEMDSEPNGALCSRAEGTELTNITSGNQPERNSKGHAVRPYTPARHLGSVAKADSIADKHGTHEAGRCPFALMPAIVKMRPAPSGAVSLRFEVGEL